MAENTDKDQGTEKKPLVLIAIDSSKQAAAAFDWYVDNLHRKENDLLLVHIADPPFVSTQQVMYMSGDLWGTMLEQEKAKVKLLEEDYANKMREKKVSGHISAVFHMKPGEALVDIAKEKHASQVVMGTRGLGTVRRTVLGSVSDYVLHHVHCPVIIYKADKHHVTAEEKHH